MSGTLLILLGLVALAGQLGLGGPLAAPATPAGPSPTLVAGSPTPARPSASASTGPSVSGSAPPASPTGPPSGEAVLVGAGDIGRCDSNADERTASLVGDIPGTVFTAGDNAYDHGSDEDFARCYGPSWGRFLDRTRPAPGNHDYQTKDAAGYRDYFGSAATPDGATWYAYGLAGWHVVVLDSNCNDLDGGCGPESAQLAWLRADLAASSAGCTVAIWHHPRFSSGDGHGDDPAVGPFWDALYAAGAEIVINGHDHDYERFAPQDPSGRSDPGGIREFVVGTGGAPLRGFDAPRPNSQVRSVLSHGVLELSLHPGSYNWRFISVDGAFSDQGSGACHG